jgi:hypothetical protein
MAHTPAPWHVEPIALGDQDSYFEVRADHRTIVQTHARENKTEARRLKEDEDNCRMIAAAPDILVALKGLLDHYPKYATEDTLEQLYGPTTTERVMAARAAITKAEGRS